jgi:hypothetical protein
MTSIKIRDLDKITSPSDGDYFAALTDEDNNEVKIITKANLFSEYDAYNTKFDNLNIINVKDYGAVGDGITDDTTAIQDAIDAAYDGGEVFLPYTDNFYLVTNLTIDKNITVKGNSSKLKIAGATNLFEITGSSNFGCPYIFDNLILEGTSNQGAGILADGNYPLVKIFRCYISDFATGIDLKGCYNSNIQDSWVNGCVNNIKLGEECHSTSLINVHSNDATNCALAINLGGGAASTTHNISVIGGAYQRSAFGISAEQALELNIYNVYCELNTDTDIRLGVADGGAYLRGTNNCGIYGMHTASNASTANITVYHSVGVQLRGLGFNTGSGSATHVSVDGFSNKVEIDYNRLANTSTPFIFSGNAASRVIVKDNGRMLIPSGMTDAINFGAYGAVKSEIWQGSVTGAGRQGLAILSSFQDMAIGTPDLVRFVDTSGGLTPATWSEKLFVDMLNNKLTLVGLNLANSSSTNIITSSGYFLPITSSDASAPNNSIYYSTDATKLVYKDSGGIVNNLY